MNKLPVPENTAALQKTYRDHLETMLQAIQESVMNFSVPDAMDASQKRRLVEAQQAWTTILTCSRDVLNVADDIQKDGPMQAFLLVSSLANIVGHVSAASSGERNIEIAAIMAESAKQSKKAQAQKARDAKAQKNAKQPILDALAMVVAELDDAKVSGLSGAEIVRRVNRLLKSQGHAEESYNTVYHLWKTHFKNLGS